MQQIKPLKDLILFTCLSNTQQSNISQTQFLTCATPQPHLRQKGSARYDGFTNGKKVVLCLSTKAMHVYFSLTNMCLQAKITQATALGFRVLT